jgi:hypothetical protein
MQVGACIGCMPGNSFEEAKKVELIFGDDRSIALVEFDGSNGCDVHPCFHVRRPLKLVRF